MDPEHFAKIEARHEANMVTARRAARHLAAKYAEARRQSVSAAAGYMMELIQEKRDTVDVLEALLEIVGEQEVGS